MRKVYAHAAHRCVDAARHVTYDMLPGTWREVPDDVAETALSAHPAKLCDVTEEEDPGAHKCRLTPKRAAAKDGAAREYERGDIPEPPRDTMARPRYSPQKRRLRQEARKRSRLARFEVRGRQGQ